MLHALRMLIPEEPEDDPALVELMHLRAQGRQPLPGHITANAAELATPCTLCGQLDWGPDTEPLKASLVFTCQARHFVKFHFHECRTPGCKGRLHVDGRDHAILRKSEGLSFAYDLMYAWANHAGLKVCTWLFLPSHNARCWTFIDVVLVLIMHQDWCNKHS